ncbi:MAG: Tol-Pal system beta propeller repeat protein TolB [Thermoanaerobaculum sp.]
MTQRPAVIVLALALAALPTVSWAQEEVYLQVTRAGVSQVVIAATPFAVSGDGAGEVYASFWQTLAQDLSSTPVMTLLPEERAALVEVDPARPDITRQRWRAVGAQFLLSGSFATSGSQVACDVRLTDLASGEVAFSRRFAATRKALPTLAHTVANELFHLFTGKSGPFLSRIAFVSDRTGTKELWIMRWDGSEQEQLTQHRSIASAPAWSPDGQWLVFTSFLRGQPQLFLLRPTEGYLKPLPSLPGVNSSPSFSPDGSKVVFAAGDGGVTNLYLLDLATNETTRLTTTRAIDTQPAFSPNGRQIVFTSTRAGSPQLYLMDAEGTNVRRLTFEDSFADEPSWASDGVRIAYTTKVDNRFQIAVFDLRTGQRTVISGPGNNESPCFSPDGTLLAFTSDRSGRKQIYITDAQGHAQPLTRDGNNLQPAWVGEIR